MVLSLPPIINGDHSKIKLSTKNILIEITATDFTKANIVLNTMVTMFSQYCATPYRYFLSFFKKELILFSLSFSIENVEVIGVDGTSQVFPDISSRTQTATLEYINRCVGVDIPSESVVTLLNRMSLPAELVGKEVHVSVPPTRSGIFAHLLCVFVDHHYIFYTRVI